MKKVFLGLVAASLLAASGTVVSCNGEASALQSQVDSLSAKVEEQAQDIENYQNCLSLFSDGLDSIAAADNSLMVVTTNKEGRVTKETVKESLSAYADMLVRQRERIKELEGKLSGTGAEMSKMQSLLAYLNKQIEEKDATIKDLQARVESKDFDIASLQGELNRLYSVNTDLVNTVQSQEEALDAAQSLLNEAYYVVGTNKELKAAGVLSKKLLGGTKVKIDDIDTEVFTRIDIRSTTRIVVEGSKSITLHSAHPSSSYRIDVDKQSKTSVLNILDEVAFWKGTRYLIIEK